MHCIWSSYYELRLNRESIHDQLFNCSILLSQSHKMKPFWREEETKFDIKRSHLYHLIEYEFFSYFSSSIQIELNQQRRIYELFLETQKLHSMNDSLAKKKRLLSIMSAKNIIAVNKVQDLWPSGIFNLHRNHA